MSEETWVNIVWVFAFAYGTVYSVLARGLIGRVMDVDTEYAGRWERPGWAARPGNALAVLEILFTMALPKPGYPLTLRRRLWVARVMLWLWPLVLASLVLLPHFASG